MIFDRTNDDVRAAISLRKQKVQKFEPLTEGDITVLERGTITINTLNRIENKQAELAKRLKKMGYWGTKIGNKVWAFDDIFDESNFKRILGNLDILKATFFELKDTPQTPPMSYFYSDINAIEKILYDLDTIADSIKENYRECGTFESGG